MNPLPFFRSARQAGFSLVTAMIFLIALTLLALVTVRGVITEERMSGNTQDWHLAFEAAEAALRDAENEIVSTTGRIGAGTAVFVAGCADGLCLPSATGIPVWTALDTSDDAWQGNASSAADSSSMVYGGITGATPFSRDLDQPVLKQPRYVIEELGPIGSNSLALSSYGGGSVHHGYRITAVGFGRIENSSGAPAIRVMLQSIFER